MLKLKRRLAVEGLEDRLVLTAPTFGVASLTVLDGDVGGSAFSGSSTIHASTDPALNGAVTFDLNVTTVSDILVLEARLDETEGKNLPGGWFNEALGGSNPDLDSFVTTPGSTVAVHGWDLGDQTDAEPLTLFDTTKDGAQDEFTFARITLLPDSDGNASAVLSGRLQTTDWPVPLIESYAYHLRIGESINVPSRTAIGTTIGYASATDADGDAISYSIVGGNDDGIFAVDPETGEISLLDQLPENVPSHPLVLQATANSESATTDIAINVLFQMSAPVFPASMDFTVDETAAVGTVLGTFAATDADGDALRYGIDFGNSEEFFAYDNATGEISVASPLNVAVDTTFTLDLKVTDASGLSDREQVDINVIAAPTDPTDVPPSFDGATVSVTSDGDNNATFTILGTYVADANSIANNPLLQGAVTYDLAVSTLGDILVLDAQFNDTVGMNVPGGWFNDTANGSDVGPPPPQSITETPQVAFDSWVTTPSQTTTAGDSTLSSNNGLDLVTYFDATDSGPQSDFTFARITLIPDANGNASAVFSGRLQTNDSNRGPIGFDSFEYRLDLGQTLSVDQNAPVGATVGFVSASDLNGDDISYAIVGGNDGDVFAINADTGEIVTQQPLTASSYSLVVEATANGQSATTTVTINVPEATNAPAFPSIEPIVMGESATVGMVIGSLSATDADGDALEYEMVTRRSGRGRPVSNFAYNSQTGEISVAEAINVQVDEIFEITLTATDPGGLSDTATIPVTVTATNDRPTISDATFEIGNNVSNGGSIGTVTAIDPNGDSLGFEIVSGNDDGLFAVDSDTGRIRAIASLDADTTHMLVIRATDPDGLSVDSTVTVNVVEIDQTPVFQNTVTGDFYLGVPAGTSAGTSLGSLAATDPFGETLQYTITESSAPGLFLLDEATGELTLARAITEEDTSGVDTGNANFRLVVEARNAADFAATATVVIVEGAPIADGTDGIGSGNNGIGNIGASWQNSTDPLDVDNNGMVTPIDALLVINELNAPTYHIAANGLLSIVEDPPWFFDVSGDSYISPVDALRIINHLNNPEAQSAASIAFATNDEPSEEDDDSEKESPLSDQLVDLAFE